MVVSRFVAAEPLPSLTGRSNEELLEVMRGGRTDRDQYHQPEKKTALPANFWMAPPREAAIALIRANASEETMHSVTFSIADPPAKKAPTAGEVGIRWEGTGSGPMAGGLTILRAAGGKSCLVYSAVALEGEATKKQIAAAVNRTETVALPEDVARQAFQVVWWLGRVRTIGEPRSRRVIVTHDMHAAFWVTPGTPRREDVTLLRAELGEDYGEEFNTDRHAGFAHFIMEEAAKQQPTPVELTTESLGAGVYPDAGFKFLRTREQPKSREETQPWITETLQILRAPRFRSWQTMAISNLVPWQDPLRYADSRIDEALFEIARANLPRSHGSPAAKSESVSGTEKAVQALAQRDRIEIFPEIMTALRVMHGSDEDDFLRAAALLASRHAELRPDIVAYLRAQLSDLAGSDHYGSTLVDTAWRFDFRELKPLLEELATANADEIEESYATLSPTRRRFHVARKILLTWNEPDPLTKLKLDAIYEASSATLFQPAELLRRGFEALPAGDQQTFQDFVQWMKAQRLPYNWSPERAEWAISPEALAAAR